MSRVFIIDGKRTAIANFLGSLSDVKPSVFGAKVVEEIIKNSNVDGEEIDEVIVGHVLGGGQGQGLGRQVALNAKLPSSVPGYSLNMVCGSGMKAIINGYANIRSGLSNLIIAGGTESMSQAPHMLPSSNRKGIKMADFNVKDHMINDGLIDSFNDYHMGITAENLSDRYNLSREAQDDFAINSQRKAIDAVDSGRFKDEIIPIEVRNKREVIIFDKDEYPNRNTTREKLGNLRAVFKKDGSITAGNASGLNDGAAFVMLASEEAVKKFDLKPMAEIVGVGQGGVDPSIMGIGPVEAIRNALRKSNLKLSDIELFELNEAFAAQSLAVLEELSREHLLTKEEILDRTNVNGGAIAIGHPLGASGSRIVVTLLHEMKKRNITYGLASLCIGGGMGTAIIIKNVHSKDI